MAEFVSGNNFIRPSQWHSVGSRIERHGHNFDHTLILFTGKIRLVMEGKVDREMYAPDHCLIPAGVEHSYEVLQEDTQVWCVFSHRSPLTGEPVPEFNGWQKAYN